MQARVTVYAGMLRRWKEEEKKMWLRLMRLYCISIRVNGHLMCLPAITGNAALKRLRWREIHCAA